MVINTYGVLLITPLPMDWLKDLFRPSNRLWLQESMMDRHCSIARTTFFSHIAPPLMQPQKSLHAPCSLAGTSKLDLMCWSQIWKVVLPESRLSRKANMTIMQPMPVHNWRGSYGQEFATRANMNTRNCYKAVRPSNLLNCHSWWTVAEKPHWPHQRFRWPDYANFPHWARQSGSEFMDISSESPTKELTAPSSADTESNTTQAAAVVTSPTSSTSRYPTWNWHPPGRLM